MRQRVRDVTNDVQIGTQRGLVLETSGGKLLCAGPGSGGTKIRESNDGGLTWSDVYTLPTASWARGIFKSSSGDLFFCTAPGGGEAGKIFRSGDDGATWSVVLTAPNATSKFWNIGEDESGNLYAGEYNEDLGPSESTIYKSTDGGATWGSFYVATVDSAAVRHTHWIDAVGSSLFAGFGETETAGTINGGKFFRIGADGSLGTLLGNAGNGMTGMLKAATGQVYLLGDKLPVSLYAFDPVSGAFTSQVRMAADLGYERFHFAGTRGRDGVLYVTGQQTAPVTAQYLFASADDGATWQVLDGNLPDNPMPITSLHASGPSGRLYIGSQQDFYWSLPDYTRAQLRQRFPV